MNKNLLYGALVVIVIIAFTVIWKNSQKEEIKGEVENKNVVTEVQKEVVPVDTAASISNDVNKIDVNSGIDADLKTLDSDVGTL